MPITLLPRTAIDSAWWDTFVSLSPQGNLYAYAWYLDIVAKDWAALVAEKNGQIEAIMPLPIKRQFGISYIEQPLFCQQLGIFCRQDTVNQELMQEFITKLLQHFRYIASYQFNYQNPLAFELAATKAIVANKQQILHTHHINLQGVNYQQIWQDYNQDRKINLKRGLQTLENSTQKGVQIIESADLAPLWAMFIQTVSHKIQGGVAASAYTLLCELFAALQKRNLAHLYYTCNADQILEAGALFTTHKGQLIYLFNATLGQYRKKNGRTLLIDKQLKIFANQANYFDFESPEVKAIAEFYKSFGAVPKPFLHWHYNKLPYWINRLKEMRRKIKSLYFFL